MDRRETKNAQDGEQSSAEIMLTDVAGWFKIIDNEHFLQILNTEFAARHTGLGLIQLWGVK